MAFWLAFWWSALTIVGGTWLAWRGYRDKPIAIRLFKTAVAWANVAAFTVMLPFLIGVGIGTKALGLDQGTAFGTGLPLIAVLAANIAAAWWLWRQFASTAGSSRDRRDWPGPQH